MSLLKNLIILLFMFFLNTGLQSQEYQHGIAMHGDVKYKKGFQNFDYANPNAPQGGKIKLSSIGTFDNLNPYILKGVAAWQMSYLF